VPIGEALALVQLYNATDGANWTDNTNWLTDPIVGNWNGVTVAGGHVTGINLHDNSLAGAIGSTLNPLAGSLTKLWFYGNQVTTLDLSVLTSLTTLHCASNDIDTLDPSAATNLGFLDCAGNNLIILDVSLLSALTYLNCSSNDITTLDLSGLNNTIVKIQAQDNGMLQSAVDSSILDIWTRRADWDDATPELNIGGTNAAPTGTYQDGYPTPLDELEMLHDLIFDDDSQGFQTWAAISWNGGSAP